MLRHLYRCALRLHPPGFRERFGGEMLSIFDQSKGRLATFRLLLDAVVSLSRQWVLRPEFWRDLRPSSVPQLASDGIPSFTSLDPFRPRTSAVIHGTVLSITLFCVTCFAIRYSWIRVLQLHIPEVTFESDPSIHPDASPGDLRGKTSLADTKDTAPIASPFLPGEISEHLKVEVMPVEPTPAPAYEAAKSNAQAISASAVPPARLATTLQLRLESYKGTYISLSPRITISIVIKNGHLVMDVAGHPGRELSPISETTFLLNGVDASWIEFDQAVDGKVRRLQLFQNGQHISAERQ